MRFSAFLLGLCVFLLASACDSTERVSVLDPPSGVPKVTPAPAPMPAQEVFVLTNTYRVSNGMAPLVWSAQLAAAAQAYAERMANEGFFSHTAPDGSTMGDRISAAGYSGSTYGENIAYGYGSPSAVMDAWIGSSGHRANLLGSWYDEIGVGYAVSKSGTAYWVQDFGGG